MSKYSPAEVKTGPIALARAPKDLQIPTIVPFCDSFPCFEASAVKQGTITEDPGK